MKNKPIIILSTVVLAALCIAAVDNSKSGGLPDLNDRLAALEEIVIAQAQEIDAQAQEMDVLKAQVGAMKPSPFTEIEAARLQYLSWYFCRNPNRR